MNHGSNEFALRRPRMRIFASLFLSAMAVAAALTMSSAANAQQGISEISGRVVNGTPGSSVPSDLQVVMLVIDETMAQIIERDPQTVAQDGTFRFTNLLQAPNYIYRIVADYGDHTPYVDVLPGGASTGLEITIWDSTPSLDDIVVESYALLVPSQSLSGRTRQIGILTVVTLRNDGDRVWIPDITGAEPGQMPDLLRFSLPDGYEGLSPENTLQTRSEILEVPTGFAIVGAVPPGTHDFIFTYVVAYDGDEFQFPINLFYGAERIRVMIPEVGAEISGEGLGDEQTTVFDDSSYRMAEGFGYARNSQFILRLTNLPEPTALQTLVDFFQGKTYILVIIWVAGAAMLAVLVYSVVAARKRPASETGTVSVTPARPRQEIVDEIAALDDQHAAGGIDDAEYAERREVLKREILGRAPEPPEER